MRPGEDQAGGENSASRLAAVFPPATPEMWRELVEGVLKGGDFERKLVGRTYDGIRIEPLYDKAEGAEPAARARHAPWRIAQRVDHPDAGEAATLALADLENGADALALVFADAPAARGFGLPAPDADTLDQALAGTMLDLVSVRLDAGRNGFSTALGFAALAERRGHALAALDIDLALDPIGAMAADGRLSAAWPVVAGRDRKSVV